MILYHWTPNKKLKTFSGKYVYAWGNIGNAFQWQDIHKGKGKIIVFEIDKARKYNCCYLALVKNIIKVY